MSDDPTRDLLKHGSFEERVLAELAAIRAEQTATRKDIAALGTRLNSVEERLGSVEERLNSVEERLGLLEERVDARLRETRPIWEAVQEAIRRLDLKFDTVLRDLYDVRTDVRVHEKRLMQLEDAR